MKKNLLKISALAFCFLFFTNTKAQNITTAVGNGFPGYTGDGGPANASQLANPYGIAIGLGDTLYIADQANSAIRKVTPTGTITTICGTGTFGYTGDGGQAIFAQLNNPNAVAVDKKGNVYIADSQNSRIRRINTSGIIITIAGTGTAGYSGDGAAATAAKISNNVSGISCDTSGNIYFTDRGNNRVRKINSTGIISTVAGTGTSGYSGDNGAATSAKLNQPIGVTYRLADTSIYITDNGNHVVRKVNKAGIIKTVVGSGTNGNT